MSSENVTPSCPGCGAHDWVAVSVDRDVSEATIYPDGTVGREEIVDGDLIEPRTFRCAAECGVIIEGDAPEYAVLEDLYFRGR